MKTEDVLIFFHHDVVSDLSNPRITSYIAYLKKQGHKPCFRFVNSNRHRRVPYLVHYMHLLISPRYQIAYFYSPNAMCVPMYLLCRLRGIQTIIEKTELDSIKPKHSWKDYINAGLYKLDELIFPSFCNKLVVISKRLQVHYQNRIQQTKTIGAFIPTGATIPKENRDVQSEVFRIGYMGSFGQKDDLQTLIQSFERLKDSVSHPVQLNLYGGHINSRFTQIPDIISHGFIERNSILDSLQSNNVLVATRTKNTYSDFGFPSKLTEYLLTGRLVIASKSSDISDLFEHKGQMYLVESENDTQLIEAFKWCNEHPEASQNMGLRGRQWATEHWDSDLILSQWYRFVTT